MNKPLNVMMEEVHENNMNKGWFNDERTFGEMTALMHSEISEALEAYRDWKMKDATLYEGAKPEGVAAEFADILIRLLDDCKRNNVDLETSAKNFGGRFTIFDRFGDNINNLHQMVSLAFMAHEENEYLGSGSMWGNVAGAFAKIYVFLTQLCEHYGIDLEAEYERKMAYNRTRPYRHGGKTL